MMLWLVGVGSVFFSFFFVRFSLIGFLFVVYIFVFFEFIGWGIGELVDVAKYVCF